MAKMFALNKILLPGDVEVPKHSVFDAKPALANQLQKLGSARQATRGEIDAAEAKASAQQGTAFESAKADDGEMIASGVKPAPEKKAPPTSGAKGDPQSAPNSKSA